MSDIVILKQALGSYDAICASDDDSLWRAYLPDETALVACLRALDSIWDLEISGFDTSSSRGPGKDLLSMVIRSATLSEPALLSAGFARYARLTD